MTHAGQIFRAAVVVSRENNGIFTRDKMRQQISVSRNSIAKGCSFPSTLAISPILSILDAFCCPFHSEKNRDKNKSAGGPGTWFTCQGLH